MKALAGDVKEIKILDKDGKPVHRERQRQALL
jgi:hypothetical protein